MPCAADNVTYNSFLRRGARIACHINRTLRFGARNTPVSNVPSHQCVLMRGVAGSAAFGQRGGGGQSSLRNGYGNFGLMRTV